MGAAWRSLCDFFCGFACPRLMISQLDVESGLMSHSTSTAVSKNDQKKVCLHST